jgi:hypothetical protein
VSQVKKADVTKAGSQASPLICQRGRAFKDMDGVIRAPNVLESHLSPRIGA